MAIVNFGKALQPVPEIRSYEHKEIEASILNQLFYPYGISIRGYIESPRLIQYRATLPMTANINKILKLEPNARIALNCDDVHMRISGNQLIIEKPGASNTTVLRQYVTNNFLDKDGLKLIMGADTENNRTYTDLAKQPHMLVAGTTGSGKSMFLHQVIISLLLRNPDLQIMAVDTKKVEFTAYEGLNNFKYISEASEAVKTLKSLIETMEQRYELFAANGWRDIDQAKAAGYDIQPIVFIADEFADLIMHEEYTKVIEESVVRLAQKARAAGIHLVIATQRPTADVLTGLIKANIPSRVCLRVTSQMESRVIMDMKGGETLLGKGDMLYLENGSMNPVRIQACYVSPDEMKAIANCIIEARQLNYHIAPKSQAPSNEPKPYEPIMKDHSDVEEKPIKHRNIWVLG